jgi:D-alanine-D-alanine ligase-like ATP-grasp enzyme
MAEMWRKVEVPGHLRALDRPFPAEDRGRTARPARSYRWFIADTLTRLAAQAGATIDLEPRYGFVGKITFPAGRTSYFHAQMLDLNPLGSSELASDKDFAAYFLARAGYPVIEGRPFYGAKLGRMLGSDQNIEAAYRYARSLGWPVIVKPNSSSQGRGVAKVSTRANFYRAARAIHRDNKVLLVQRFISGRDYRLVVLDDAVISAYERLPLSVVGDGRSTIRQLFDRKQREFVRAGRDTTLDGRDFRIEMHLREQRLRWGSVLPPGTAAALLANKNLSTGGDAVEALDTIHPGFVGLAVAITAEMGLRLCGVDLLLPSGSLADPPADYAVIEINAAPGLDNYASSGAAQAARVDDLYLAVFKALRRR